MYSQLTQFTSFLTSVLNNWNFHNKNTKELFILPFVNISNFFNVIDVVFVIVVVYFRRFGYFFCYSFKWTLTQYYREFCQTNSVKFYIQFWRYVYFCWIKQIYWRNTANVAVDFIWAEISFKVHFPVSFLFVLLFVFCWLLSIYLLCLYWW